ncbi:MAG TPA: aminoglycoside phosphotransferase family protein [Chitinophagaceae bacterium]|nr:aminoglycoside phosphotransferase family protein [Chitinophagaceae bacterium]
MLKSVLKEFGLNANDVTITPIHQGLINLTWKVGQNGHAFILQQVNSTVFQNPEDIAFNIEEISRYLKLQHPEYFFVYPVKTFDGNELVYKNENGYFRVFPFVQESHAINVVETPEQAYEGAKQFGKLTALLSGFDCTKLKITVPHFHDLSLRYEQFEEALIKGNNKRLKESATLISQLKEWVSIVTEFEKIKRLSEFKLRVTHHDSKINNVLFNENNKGLCVIDLDTVMPGYFISDVGDMMRTYLSPVSEEENDFSKIVIRKDYYKAIVDGYGSEMKDELTKTEKGYLFYAGKFSIYMQALRFLTDYLNDDKYYGAAYPEQNLVRTSNQIVLLQKFIQAESELNNIKIES